MNKQIIIGLALALVLVSGLFVNARADCGCLPQISQSSCLSCQQQAQDRDYDNPNATCQGADRYGPATPDPMGSPGV
jgi:hypothetical protein